jgi:hypothetical protein
LSLIKKKKKKKKERKKKEKRKKKKKKKIRQLFGLGKRTKTLTYLGILVVWWSMKDKVP